MGKAPSNYFAQLDAFRGIAVLFVLVHHLIPGAADVVAWGPLGVRLFFVLSGFLITGILLDRREKSENRWETWIQFYYRRAIRIFPIYFLAIGLLAFLNVEPIRQVIGWLMTFTINFYMGMTGQWAGCVSHFWFLAVGEQFYLVWTLALLFLPKRALLPTMIGIICLAPAIRLCGVSVLGWREMMVWYSPLSSMDSLGLGALMGWLHREHRDATTAWMKQVAVGWVAFGLLVVACVIRVKWNSLSVIHGVETLEALAFSWLIYRAAIGFEGGAQSILLSPGLVYTGMISYGLYLYHPMVHTYVTYSYKQTGIPSDPHLFGVIGATFFMTFIISTFSWFAIENPIGNLKKKASR